MERKNWKLKTGIILIIISVILFLTLFSMPFITMSVKYKVALSTGLLIAGEVTFWGGTLLLGKEVWNKYKAFIKSAFLPDKKKNTPDN